MAYPKYIKNGITENVAWINHIAVSADGNSWEPINMAGISIHKYAKSINSGAPNSHPGPGSESGVIVILKRADDSQGPVLKFNPSEVIGQAGWVAGSPSANADAAIADIGTWLGV